MKKCIIMPEGQNILILPKLIYMFIWIPIKIPLPSKKLYGFGTLKIIQNFFIKPKRLISSRIFVAKK